jgi:hypothetical protein
METETHIAMSLWNLFRKETHFRDPSEYNDEEITEWAAEEIIRLRASQRKENDG